MFSLLIGGHVIFLSRQEPEVHGLTEVLLSLGHALPKSQLPSFSSQISRGALRDLGGLQRLKIELRGQYPGS